MDLVIKKLADQKFERDVAELYASAEDDLNVMAHKMVGSFSGAQVAQCRNRLKEAIEQITRKRFDIDYELLTRDDPEIGSDLENELFARLSQTLDKTLDWAKTKTGAIAADVPIDNRGPHVERFVNEVREDILSRIKRDFEILQAEVRLISRDTDKQRLRRGVLDCFAEQGEKMAGSAINAKTIAKNLDADLNEVINAVLYLEEKGLIQFIGEPLCAGNGVRDVYGRITAYGIDVRENKELLREKIPIVGSVTNTLHIQTMTGGNVQASGHFSTQSNTTINNDISDLIQRIRDEIGADIDATEQQKAEAIGVVDQVEMEISRPGLHIKTAELLLKGIGHIANFYTAMQAVDALVKYLHAHPPF